MASGKKKVTQAELRRLMNEHKGKIPKKIVSPVAKYSTTGILSCTLCNVTIVSETVWEAHTKSRKHLDHLQRLRDAVRPSPAAAAESSPALHTWKRAAPVSPLPVPPEKKIKGILKNAPQIVIPIKKTDEKDKPSSVDKLRRTSSDELAPSFHHLETKSNLKGKGHIKTVQTRESAVISQDLCDVELTRSTSSKLPENFFDSSTVVVSNRTEELLSKDTTEDAITADDALPEGFFDDPELDAKARNIEYKNPVEEEWEKFQKEIKEQSSVSAQIISEDQDEATVARQMEEIDEQMRNWTRVLDLEVKKENLEQVKIRGDGGDDDTSSNDEDEFQEFLDWRIKKAYE